MNKNQTDTIFNRGKRVQQVDDYFRIEHPFLPTWNDQSEILILGSFPSVKSRESRYYYGHPRNRFWTVMARVFQDRCPEGITAKQSFLLEHHVAVWDVIASCRIEASADSSIRDAVPNNIQMILEKAAIRQIYTNGQTAHKLYQRFLLPLTGRDDICLPSTSPANAAWDLERLTDAWSIITLYALPESRTGM